MNEKKQFKFDVVIGNPPYQDDPVGKSTKKPPIYNLFMDDAYKIGEIVELITPSRFLFNAGSTPKRWNKKMLNDKHLKVLFYEPNALKVFSNVGFKGGVAVTYRNKKENYGAINVFIPSSELNSIVKKVSTDLKKSGSLMDIIYLQNKFNLDILNNDYPELKKEYKRLKNDKRLESNAFKLPIFNEIPNSDDDLKILGLINKERVYRYIDKKYIDMNHNNISKYKVLLAKANGSGVLGEKFSTPLIGTPLIGFTRSFISIGAFDNKVEAEAALKYIKGKFSRIMLGVLKITQDNNPAKWKFVPLQDFTPNSDIDWTQSIHDIDLQLYKKYGLDEKEIEFIETKVKEMN